MITNKVDSTKQNQGSVMLKQIALAFLIIFGLGVLFIMLVNLGRSMSDPETVTAETIVVDPWDTIPCDFPVYEGAVLKSVNESPDGITARFIFSLGTHDVVRNYYLREMPNSGWIEYTSSSQVLGFYKDDGKRRIQMKFGRYAGRTIVDVSICDQ